MIDNCSLGYKITDSIGTFTLWSAACLLGLKYKMTAHKIHTAVKEQNVANRASYQ
jgi:hypothetical protein